MHVPLGSEGALFAVLFALACKALATTMTRERARTFSTVTASTARSSTSTVSAPRPLYPLQVFSRQADFAVQPDYQTFYKGSSTFVLTSHPNAYKAMPRFAARQHDPLRTATGRRHHLNLLLHDYDLENDKTYGSRGAGLLSGIKLRQSPTKTAVETEIPARSPDSNSLRYAHQLPSLTQQALAMTGTVQLQDSATSTNASGSCTVPVVAPELLKAEVSSTSSKAAPVWLTPQQLQSRQLGMKVAKMMTSHRTPIGAFANFDMPVAP